MRERVEVYFHLGGGDPRGDRCIATLACLALLHRRLLKLTSPAWLTFPNEPSDQIQPCCPHSLLIRAPPFPRVSYRHLMSPLKSRLLNSVKELHSYCPSNRVQDECQHIEDPQSTRVNVFQSWGLRLISNQAKVGKQPVWRIGLTLTSIEAFFQWQVIALQCIASAKDHYESTDESFL